MHHELTGHQFCGEHPYAWRPSHSTAHIKMSTVQNCHLLVSGLTSQNRTRPCALPGRSRAPGGLIMPRSSPPAGL
jgi:hypothetical protein